MGYFGSKETPGLCGTTVSLQRPHRLYQENESLHNARYLGSYAEGTVAEGAGGRGAQARDWMRRRTGRVTRCRNRLMALH